MRTVLRTSASRFTNLKDYNFQPNYIEIDDLTAGSLRMHYLDEGHIEDPVVLLLHGEPTWSYIYRSMINILKRAGLRVVVPDLIGFGKSDKPIDRDIYTYKTHIDWFSQFINKLKLHHIAFFGQDWGGLIGLRVLTRNPNIFRCVMVANTMLPCGDEELGLDFQSWRQYSQASKSFEIGNLIHRGTYNGLLPHEIEAYNAPFPDNSYKAAARQFPILVPANTKDPEYYNQLKAWDVLKKLQKPFLTCFSDCDPITRGLENSFIKAIPGAYNQDHFITKNAGHFLQEDQGKFLAERFVEFIKKNPTY